MREEEKISGREHYSASLTLAPELTGKSGPGGVVTDEAAQQATLFPESHNKLG